MRFDRGRCNIGVTVLFQSAGFAQICVCRDQDPTVYNAIEAVCDSQAEFGCWAMGGSVLYSVPNIFAPWRALFLIGGTDPARHPMMCYTARWQRSQNYAWFLLTCAPVAVAQILIPHCLFPRFITTRVMGVVTGAMPVSKAAVVAFGSHSLVEGQPASTLSRPLRKLCQRTSTIFELGHAETFGV